MKLRLAPLTCALLGLAMLGCNGDDGSKAPTGPPKDGLKELGKEDVVVGKPTPHNPRVKPIEIGDTVWVVYTGKFKDGRVFDTNDPKVKPGSKPFMVIAGAPGMVIEGWQKGFYGMLPGGERKLSVPWKMGYGEQGKDPIPPYTDLYFDIKVLDYVKRGEEYTYGLYDVTKGTGAPVKPGSTCTFHTVVMHVDRSVIEDTHKAKPVVAKQGAKEVLAAVDDALLGMREGGVRELSVPPQIGFPPLEDVGTDTTTFTYIRIELIDVK